MARLSVDVIETQWGTLSMAGLEPSSNHALRIIPLWAMLVKF